MTASHLPHLERAWSPSGFLVCHNGKKWVLIDACYSIDKTLSCCMICFCHNGFMSASKAAKPLQGEDVENIGYVIPVDVVQHFITDFDLNGKFTSFPILGIEWQKMESPYLRKAMGMKVSLTDTCIFMTLLHPPSCNQETDQPARPRAINLYILCYHSVC